MGGLHGEPDRQAYIMVLADATRVSEFMTRMAVSGVRMAAVAVFGLGLAACTAPTPYQPADGGFGFSTQQIEDNRYRVTFAGNADTPRETVQNYLLYRAAEVTLESGHDYFTVVDQDVERSTRYFGTVDPLFYPGGWHGRRGFYAPLAGYSTLDAHPVDRYSASADILVHEGEKPADDVNAYDASDVVRRLGPAIVRPEGDDEVSDGSA